MKTTPRSVHSRVWIMGWSFAIRRSLFAIRQMLSVKCQMLLSDFSCSVDGDKGRGRGCFFYVGTALCILALDQANHAGDIESGLAGRFDRLHSGATGRANIIHDDHARALFAEAFDALACAVLLFGLAHQKAVQRSAYHRDGHDNRSEEHTS